MKKLIPLACIVLGSVQTFGQTINISTTQIDSFMSVIHVPSTAKPYIVQGTGLTNDIVIHPLYGESECSLTNNPFVPSTNLHLTPVAGVVQPTTVYVRMVPTVYPLSLTTGDMIAHTSTGAVTKNLIVTGFVLAPEPTVQSTLSFGPSTNNSITLNVSGGSMFQLLVAKESAPVDFEPQDSRAYSYAPRQFGVGYSAVGNGNYIVAGHQLWYGGPVIITGLSPNKTYHFAVFNYEIGMYDGPYGDAYYSENYLLPGGTGNATTLNLGPLPIVINYINGTKQGSKHLLNWKVTCISSPRVTMVLERSADSRNFTGINSITADAVRCNQPFDYTDIDPLKGMNYYRLKMTDTDGKISYSSIVALLNAVKGFDIVGITPNPVVDDNLKLNVTSAQAGKIDIAIYDMQGRLVNRQSISLIAGFNNLPIYVSNLSPGTYTIQGIVADERSKIIRFVKQ